MPEQDETQPKRRGRPRKPAVAGERKSIAFRVTEEVYNYLVSVSEHSGYSISEVVERHLEAQKEKVGRPSLEQWLIGRAESIELLRYYAMILATYDRMGDWKQNEAVRAGVLAAMSAVNNRLIPLDTSKFGPGLDPADPQVAALNAAWAAGAQLGTIISGPLVPADVGAFDEDLSGAEEKD